MYIGGTDERGLQQVISCLMNSALDEADFGRVTHIRVVLNADGSCRYEDDRCEIGIDGEQPQLGDRFLEVNAVTTKWGNIFPIKRTFRYSELAYVIAGALSQSLAVEFRANATSQHQTFAHGKRLTSTISQTPNTTPGITVQFKPDPEIFGDRQFDSELASTHCRRMAYLNSDVRFAFEDRRTGEKFSIQHDDGAARFAADLAVHEPLKYGQPLHLLETSVDGADRVEIGLQFFRGRNSTFKSICNDVDNYEGGTHADGFREGLHATFRSWASECLQIGDDVEIDPERGLAAVVIVHLEDPKFEGACRQRLSNPEVTKAVSETLSHGLRDYFDSNPDLAGAIVHNAILQACE